MGLSAVQQYLLSHFNLTKVSSLASTLKVLEEIIKETNASFSCTEERLSEEIAKINETIKNYDLEITESVDEITCEKIFVLINTADSLVTQKVKFYDDNTSQFFAKIVKDCMLSEESCVSDTHCLNLSMQVKLSKASSQSVLEKLIKHKWLISTNDKIYLGMRSIVELEQNIKKCYPDSFKNCCFCKLLGFMCKNCQIKSHFACLKKYYTLSKANAFCPNCKEVWDYISQDLVGEVNEIRELPKETNVLSCSSRKKKRI